MGMLWDGEWIEEDRHTGKHGGSPEPRHDIHGLAAAIARSPGRYWLIASASCPWSHRPMLVRAAKDLAGFVPLHLAFGVRRQGYAVNGNAPWRVPGTQAEIRNLHELYTMHDRAFTGRVTVPVLWDSEDRSIVSRSSETIMRVLDLVLTGGKPDYTFRPPDLASKIDDLNRLIHEELATAVYRAGLARSQDDYGRAVADVFRTLDLLERRLGDDRFLFSDTVTESDWRLFATLVRFDSTYFTHFRCTVRRLTDYRNLWPYARDIYALPGIAETVDWEANQIGYYANDGAHNPFGIVAALPDIDWHEPHGREALGPILVVGRDGHRLHFDKSASEQLDNRAHG